VTGYFHHARLPLDQTFRIMDAAHELMLDHERFISSSLVLELVGASKCTSYDCEYVALAREMNLPLVTFDKQVVGQFPRVAVFPPDFINF
jgi:predicted nucleic acid-binding protein